MLIEKNPGIKLIELSNWGEIFLNPELKKIIKFAYEKNIGLKATNGANLNDVDDELLEYLVKYKFRRLLVSIDGASNETYKIYRKGGNFNKVIENIKKINNYKKVHGSEYPKLMWQFVIFGHNEHELEAARSMAKELGMIFIPKLNWNASYSPIKDKDYVSDHSGLGAATKKEFEQKHKISYTVPCFQLWNAPQINWDGKLLGCFKNYWQDFGNVFDSGLKELLDSERYEYAKRMILGKEKAMRDDIPCSRCSQYLEHFAIEPLCENQIFVDYCMRIINNR
jgi:MoaA/NifB/PqqE/SkfB family radical SAM enzyme